jgi:hypothetical protein
VPDLSPQFDFATKKIRHRSTPNVETERLHARLNYLDKVHFPGLLTSNLPLSKQEVAQKAGEGATIARELHKRGESLDAYHPRWSSRDALGPKRNLPAR